MKIVLVDDEKTIRNVLSTFLSDEGHSVRVANDGRHSLELLEEDLPDVVLSDVKMPVMDGMELLKKIQQNYDLPFVIITGYADMEMAVEALNNGAFFLLHKPLSFQKLKDVLRLVMEKKEKKRHLINQ